MHSSDISSWAIIGIDRAATWMWARLDLLDHLSQMNLRSILISGNGAFDLMETIASEGSLGCDLPLVQLEVNIRKST